MPVQKEDSYKLDELDSQILQEFLVDARTSFRELAKKLGRSPATIVNRTKNLEKRGIIKKYSAILDHEKLGYQLTTVIEVIVSKGKLMEVEKEIANMSPCVAAVYDATGATSDIIVIAKTKSREDLSNLVKTILSMEFVDRTNTHLVLSTVKEDFQFL